MDVIDLKYKKMADKHLCEIYQSVQLKYAFLSADNEQVAVFALCRDFLHDMVKTYLTNGNMSIYSMTYNYGKNPPIDMSKMRMLARYDGIKPEDIDIEMEYAIKLIHYYEDILKVEHSKVERLSDSQFKDNKATVWLFTGDKVWMSAPFMVSLYTMLMRLGKKKIEFTDSESLHDAIEKLCNGPQDNDVRYLKSIKEKTEFILEHLKELKQDEEIDPAYYDKNLTIDAFHNNCGICALAGKEYYGHKKTAEILNKLWENKDKEKKQKEPQPVLKEKIAPKKKKDEIPLLPVDVVVEEPITGEVETNKPKLKPKPKPKAKAKDNWGLPPEQGVKDMDFGWAEPDPTAWPSTVAKLINVKKPIKKTTVKKTKAVAKAGIAPIKKIVKKKKKKPMSYQARLLSLQYLKEKNDDVFGGKYAKKIDDWM